jgi:hypothetical protein
MSRRNEIPPDALSLVTDCYALPPGGGVGDAGLIGTGMPTPTVWTPCRLCLPRQAIANIHIPGRIVVSFASRNLSANTYLAASRALQLLYCYPLK